jgi:hypothetical protein
MRYSTSPSKSIRAYAQEPENKDPNLLWRGTEYTIKGKVVTSTKFGAVVSLVSPSLLVVRPSTKSAPAMH